MFNLQIGNKYIIYQGLKNCNLRITIVSNMAVNTTRDDSVHFGTVDKKLL